MTDEPQLLDMREAAALLGWRGRWAGVRLLRKLKALEKKTGTTLLVVTGGEREGTRYHVTRGGLLQLLPKLWVTNSELLRSISSGIRDLRVEVGELTRRIEDVEFRLGACEQAIGGRRVDGSRRESTPRRSLQEETETKAAVQRRSAGHATQAAGHGKVGS